MVKVGITEHRGLPASRQADQYPAVRRELDTFDPEELVGVSCMADGADMLFADAVLARGGASKSSCRPPATETLPEGHHADYDRIIAQAATIHRLDYVESTAESHMAASRLMLTEISELVAVWDWPAGPLPSAALPMSSTKHGSGASPCVAWPMGQCGHRYRFRWPLSAAGPPVLEVASGTGTGG